MLESVVRAAQPVSTSAANGAAIQRKVTARLRGNLDQRQAFGSQRYGKLRLESEGRGLGQSSGLAQAGLFFARGEVRAAHFFPRAQGRSVVAIHDGEASFIGGRNVFEIEDKVALFAGLIRIRIMPEGDYQSAIWALGHQ